MTIDTLQKLQIKKERVKITQYTDSRSQYIYDRYGQSKKYQEFAIKKVSRIGLNYCT